VEHTDGGAHGIDGVASALSSVAMQSSSATCTHEQRNGVRWCRTRQRDGGRDDALAHRRERRRHGIVARPVVAQLGTAGHRLCDDDLQATTVRSEDDEHDKNGGDGAFLPDKDGGEVRTGVVEAPAPLKALGIGNETVWHTTCPAASDRRAQVEETTTYRWAHSQLISN
jgi:hypothetical protein